MIPKGRENVLPDAIIDKPSPVAQERQVIFNCILDSIRAGINQLAAGFTGLLLGLLESEDDCTIGVGYIVGCAYGVGDIGLIAGISTDNPFALNLALAVAKMQPFTDAHIIGLATRFEPAPGGPRFQPRIPNPLGHVALRLSNG